MSNNFPPTTICSPPHVLYFSVVCLPCWPTSSRSPLYYKDRHNMGLYVLAYKCGNSCRCQRSIRRWSRDRRLVFSANLLVCYSLAAGRQVRDVWRWRPRRRDNNLPCALCCLIDSHSLTLVEINYFLLRISPGSHKVCETICTQSVRVVERRERQFDELGKKEFLIITAD